MCWSAYDDGKTKRKFGSEGGRIIRNENYFYSTRIARKELNTVCAVTVGGYTMLLFIQHISGIQKLLSNMSRLKVSWGGHWYENRRGRRGLILPPFCGQILRSSNENA